jgi:hypothetical protein
MPDLSEQAEPEEGGGVGYGRPPLHSRFRAGHSGNPLGRPKRKRAVEDLVNDMLSEKIWVTTQGKRKRVAVELGILYRIREKAFQGDLRAAQLLFALKATAQSDQGGGSATTFLSEEDLAILVSVGLVPGMEDHDVGA